MSTGTIILILLVVFGVGVAYFFVGLSVAFVSVLYRELEEGGHKKTIFDRGFRFNRQDILFGFFWPLVLAFFGFAGCVCCVWTVLRLEPETGVENGKK